MKTGAALAETSTAADPSLPGPSDPVASAKFARLRYVTDASPGFRRRRSGKGFVYTNAEGKAIRNADEIRRIQFLAIPPAWSDVWICPLENGHLQATGRDAKGRKQHRYHPRWRETRDQTKYDKMLAFAEQLPAIRRQVKRDLALPGLPRAKILATVVRLLETGMIRVGNEEYARQNKSFGVATLRARHVAVSGPKIKFEFRGKSGVQHAFDLDDRRLAKIIKQCQELPGHELFQYIDDHGERGTIESTDVNDYLRAIAGDDFSSKDFRTWAGTVLAARALTALCSVKPTKKNLARAIESVAKQLGNTVAVCRKCYIHPAVLEGYLSGFLSPVCKQGREKLRAARRREFKEEEAAVMALLRRTAKPGNNGANLSKQLRTSLQRANAAKRINRR